MVTLKVRHFARHSDNLSLDKGISLSIWFVKCFFLGGGGEVLAGIGSGCFCVRGDRDSSVCRWSLSRGRGGVRDCFFICMGFLAQEEAEVGSDNTIYYVNFQLPALNSFFHPSSLSLCLLNSSNSFMICSCRLDKFFGVLTMTCTN